ACPESADGTACDGRDLRPYLGRANATVAAATGPLRHSLCGHHTKRGTAPTRQRYLLTRPGTVGRCVDNTLPACSPPADCAGGGICLAGRCTVMASTGCATNAQCSKGSLCLAGRCQAGPPCIDDATCVTAFSSFKVQCAGREQKWCRNAPDRTC